MGRRFLVFGDNHGDTESLRRVLDDTEGETFDYAVHVGDFTRAYRDTRERGVEQLDRVEPLLAEFDDRARHGLVWVWGNQDYFGDLDYEIGVGIEAPDDGTVSVGGQRFTGSPDHVAEDVILVTHMETWSRLDNFDGLAHFCGNTHRGRYLGDKLNSAFLKVTRPETDETYYGGYLVVEVEGEGTADGGGGIVDVEMRTVGSLDRVVCGRHDERGVQFQPEFRGCMYCDDDRVLYREMAATAFYGLTGASADDTWQETVADADLLDYAVDLWDDPPERFHEEFAAYLDGIEDDRYAPLARADGRLTVAERSYAY